MAAEQVKRGVGLGAGVRGGTRPGFLATLPHPHIVAASMADRPQAPHPRETFSLREFLNSSRKTAFFRAEIFWEATCVSGRTCGRTYAQGRGVPCPHPKKVFRPHCVQTAGPLWCAKILPPSEFSGPSGNFPQMRIRALRRFPPNGNLVITAMPWKLRWMLCRRQQK